MTIRVSHGRDQDQWSAPTADEPPARPVEIRRSTAEVPANPAAIEIERLLAAAELIADPCEAVRRLRRAALLLEGQAGEPARAFDTLVQAFRRTPGDREVVTALERLADQQGRWEPLLRLAEEVMMEADEPSAVGQLWARLARWCRRAGLWERALSAGENALALSPDDETVFLELEEIYRMGVSGVPCFIIDNRYAVVGAHPAEILVDAVRKAAEPALEPVSS